VEVELAEMNYEITVGESTHQVHIKPLGDASDNGLRRYRIQIDDREPIEVERGRPVPDVLSLLINGRSLDAGLVPTDEGFQVELVGTLHDVSVVDPRRKALRMGGGAAGGAIITKMPGRIVSVLVEVGQAVSKGDPVVVVEAMKMENQLKAAADGTVIAIKVAEGDLVEAKTVLIELELS
jgi:acetyl/propionyl-CoA carboxylase alpha subunit